MSAKNPRKRPCRINLHITIDERNDIRSKSGFSLHSDHSYSIHEKSYKYVSVDTDFLARRDILITERKKKCILKEGVPGYELYRMER